MSKKEPVVVFGKHKYPPPSSERINQQFGKPKPSAIKTVPNDTPPPPKEDEP